MIWKSTEVGVNQGLDYVTRSLSGFPAGGLLFSAWTKIPDPGAAPWSRGNMQIFGINATNWTILGIVSNDDVTGSGGPGTGKLNCNLMLFMQPSGTYVSDFAYYDSGPGAYSAAQLKGWIFVAWWLQPGNTFTMRQYLRIGPNAAAFDATAPGTDTTTAIPGAADPANNFSVGDPSNDFHGYIWHAKVVAQATAPTLAQIDALALATAPDTGAWGDWLFDCPGGVFNVADQSGNGRSLTNHSGGTLLQGPDSPPLAVVVQGTSAVSFDATTPAPTYPTLLANDGLLLFVGQKPTAANSGAVTTPTGYTLIGSKLAAGGYSTTTGSDVGNTNLFVYKKDSVTGSETGTLPITTTGSDVTWAFFLQFRSGNGLYDFAVTSAEDSTGGDLSLAFGTVDVAAQDLLVAAFCLPTNAATFVSQAFSGTGLVTDTAMEINDSASAINNHIGEMACFAPVTVGVGSTAITLAATANGTTTNARGPGLLVRVREGVSATTQASVAWLRF